MGKTITVDKLIVNNLYRDDPTGPLYRRADINCKLQEFYRTTLNGKTYIFRYYEDAEYFTTLRKAQEDIKLSIWNWFYDLIDSGDARIDD